MENEEKTVGGVAGAGDCAFGPETTATPKIAARSKFQCNSKEETTNGISYTFVTVTSGSKENEEFFKYTPSGAIKLQIVNENVKFVVGKFYYVDFTEAE